MWTSFSEKQGKITLNSSVFVCHMIELKQLYDILDTMIERKTNESQVWGSHDRLVASESSANISSNADDGFSASQGATRIILNLRVHGSHFVLSIAERDRAKGCVCVMFFFCIPQMSRRWDPGMDE